MREDVLIEAARFFKGVSENGKPLVIQMPFGKKAFLVGRLRMQDVRIDTYTHSSPNVLMTLTHVPTGKSVRGQGRMTFKLRERLLDELSLLLAAEGG